MFYKRTDVANWAPLEGHGVGDLDDDLERIKEAFQPGAYPSLWEIAFGKVSLHNATMGAIRPSVRTINN